MQKMNIKEVIRDSGFKQWEVAEVMKISEVTLCRWLRRPEKLNDVIIERIIEAIDYLNSGY